MKSMKMVAILILTALLIVLASGCGRISATTTNGSTTPTATPGKPEAVKPKPVVLGIDATTSGMYESYYAILNVTVRNDGAHGMMILIGKVTQANESVQRELPVYLAQGVTETVSLILPLKWRGGDWTPSVLTEVP